MVPPGSPGQQAARTRDDAAAELVNALQTRLRAGDRSAAIDLAAPGDAEARAELRTIFDNVRQLRLTELTLRYVDEDTGVGGGDTFGADVQLSWRIAGFDSSASRMEVQLLLTQTPRGAAFVSARTAAGDRPGRGEDPVGAPVGQSADGTPLWLLGDLGVERSPRALVMVARQQGAVDRYAMLADRAVADVKRVLDGWGGKMVVEVPASQGDLEQVLGVAADSYRSIAAVTSTVDGSTRPSSPVHILVNPSVFDRLSGDGAQIVMSHEATHVATRAATSSMPMWLLEGFADYVALDDIELPVSVTASQILAEVRKDGSPRRLPTASEFDPSNKSLGTSYEAAWLACRYIGAEYGERTLVAFYDAVDEGLPVRDGFRRYLATDRRGFTEAWQGYLTRLAA